MKQEKTGENQEKQENQELNVWGESKPIVNEVEHDSISLKINGSVEFYLTPKDSRVDFKNLVFEYDRKMSTHMLEYKENKLEIAAETKQIQALVMGKLLSDIRDMMDMLLEVVGRVFIVAGTTGESIH
jgi:hypothetical protein